MGRPCGSNVQNAGLPHLSYANDLYQRILLRSFKMYILISNYILICIQYEATHIASNLHTCCSAPPFGGHAVLSLAQLRGSGSASTLIRSVLQAARSWPPTCSFVKYNGATTENGGALAVKSLCVLSGGNEWGARGLWAQVLGRRPYKMTVARPRTLDGSRVGLFW
eukprot:COSAG02_NODE_3160_length_7253_cov_17.821778_3_plen_166_part_00